MRTLGFRAFARNDNTIFPHTDEMSALAASSAGAEIAGSRATLLMLILVETPPLLSLPILMGRRSQALMPHKNAMSL